MGNGKAFLLYIRVSKCFDHCIGDIRATYNSEDCLRAPTALVISYLRCLISFNFHGFAFSIYMGNEYLYETVYYVL